MTSESIPLCGDWNLLLPALRLAVEKSRYYKIRFQAAAKIYIGDNCFGTGLFVYSIEERKEKHLLIPDTIGRIPHDLPDKILSACPFVTRRSKSTWILKEEYAREIASSVVSEPR